MFANYLKIALRNLAKYRLYALINIIGLSLGLAVFMFCFMLVAYEKNHDNIFSKRAQIFIVSSLFSESSGEPIAEYPIVRLAYGPLFKKEIPEASLVARTIHKEKLLTYQGIHQYVGIRFVDPDFTGIFDFDYVHGNKNAINITNGLIVTDTMAVKLFGHTDVLGRGIEVGHQHTLKITAVIKEVPQDSHFNSSLLPDSQLTAIASITTLSKIDPQEASSLWKGLNPINMTYLLMPKDRGIDWLQQQVEQVFARYTPADELNYIDKVKVRPLIEVNTIVWDALGFPVLGTIQLLALLVLVTACLNYANLATAQSFNRTKEVGLRKTFGAERSQLFAQFLIESTTIALFAMIIALSAIELIIPTYNIWMNKAVKLNYMTMLPWLLSITLVVGLLAGAYPAYLISRHRPIDSLRKVNLKGRKGNLFRSLMITAQFSISIFILAMVMIIYFQNEKVQSFGNIFPRDDMLIVDRIDIDAVKDKQQLLKNKLAALEGVEAVTFSSGVPFLNAGASSMVSSNAENRNEDFYLSIVSIDDDFLTSYEIELIAGQTLGSQNENHLISSELNNDMQPINILINLLAAKELGLVDDELNLNFNGKELIWNKIIGKTVYQISSEQSKVIGAYKIVGVMPDQYFLGVHMAMRPLAFIFKPQAYKYASIKLDDKNREQTLKAIDEVWRGVVIDYPMRSQPLNAYFNRFFRIPTMINSVIAVFSGIALSLALIGLFGLSAFMAQNRTKEIGIRKVMGASVYQIVSLLIWQFSKPVLWSLFIALPLAYFASKIYLDFFAERIDFVIPILILASLVTIFTAWSIVAVHAINIAQAKPVQALSYE